MKSYIRRANTLFYFTKSGSSIYFLPAFINMLIATGGIYMLVYKV